MPRTLSHPFLPSRPLPSGEECPAQPDRKRSKNATCCSVRISLPIANAAPHFAFYIFHFSFFISLFLLLLFSTCLPAHAGTTGKITGQVTDREGNPLPGASVVIEGTRRGTDTDEEGFYVLLSVEPGVHTLAASMVGFRSDVKEGVVVSSDFTTNASFVLMEETLALGEVVVKARRGGGGWGMLAVRGDAPPVEPDRSTTMYRITAADIDAVPMVRATEAFIELQPGVTVDARGNTLTVRAGDAEDVAYYVDGVRVTAADELSSTVYQLSAPMSAQDQTRVYGGNLNRTAIQELTVVTGGMDAEYGNAQGGIISVVGREGGQRYSGLVDYRFTPPGRKHWGESVYDSPIHRDNVRWDDPEWVNETVTLPDGRIVQAHRRLDYTGVSGHFLEGNVSGPLARDLTFFATARWRREASVFPSSHLATPFNINTSLKLSYEVSSNLKLRVGGFYDRRRGAFQGLSTGGRLDLCDSGKNLFLADPNPAGGFFDTDYLAYAEVTHLLGKRTFYEVRVSQSASRRDTADVSLPEGIIHISEATTGNPVTDRGRHYTVYRDVVSWDRFNRNRTLARADLSSQVHRSHLLKAGFELIRYNNWYQRYSSEAPDHRFVTWYAKTYEDTDFFPGRRNQGVAPVQLGAYAQDKIELDGMVVNAGLRFDALFQNAWVTDVNAYYGVNSPMWDRMTRCRNVPTVKGAPIKSWSPMLGVSHPITERAVMRYFYGRFTQLPPFFDLFCNAWASAQTADEDLNGNGAIDPGERWNTFQADTRYQGFHHNPHLPPEETTSFELGADWNFAGDYVLGLTAYYKSTGHEADAIAWQVWVDPKTRGAVAGGSAVVHGVYRDVRGLELNLKKRLSRMFAFNLALNLQWADDGDNTAYHRRMFPDSLFVANGHYWVMHDVDPATGAEIPVSLQEMAVREGRDPDYYARSYGANANAAIRLQYALMNAPERENWFWVPWLGHYASEGIAFHSGERDRSFYSEEDRHYWERVNGRPDYPGTGEGNLLVAHSYWSEERGPVPWDRRCFGSLTFLLVTPPDFGPLRGSVLGNVRANLIYRAFTGTPFEFKQVGVGFQSGQSGLVRYGPMHTRTDLSVEKQVGNASGLNVALGIDIYNLFNQKDPRSVVPGDGLLIDFNGPRWQNWGIEGLDPTGSDFQTYRQINDMNSYWDQPREMRLSLRVKW